MYLDVKRSFLTFREPRTTKTRPRPPRFFPFLARDKEKKVHPPAGKGARPTQEAHCDAPRTPSRSVYRDRGRRSDRRPLSSFPRVRVARRARSVDFVAPASAISSHPPRASDAIGSGKMAEGLQINPDRELTFRCASPTRGVVNPARPARDRWSPRPALVVPPRFARHFPRARAPRADDPDSFADAPVSPVRAPLNSQSSSRSRSRRRSACTTPARPRWPSR